MGFTTMAGKTRIEIRAAEGGEDSLLFAAQLHRAYQRLALRKR